MPGTARKIWHILTPRQQRLALVMFGLMLIGMILEMFGIGLIIPAVSILTNSSGADGEPVITRWIPAARSLSHPQLVVAGLSVLVAVYAIKTAFLAFLLWYQVRFIFGLQASLSQRLFAGYLRMPWTFHLQHNSAHLLRNATLEVTAFTTVAQAFILACTELFAVAGVAVLVIAIEPIGAVVVISSVAAAAGINHWLTRARLLRWGEARQLHDGLRIQHLQQGFGGLKDLKLLGREEDFVAQYAVHNTAVARVAGHQFVLQQLPRLWLEFLAIVGLAGLAWSMLLQGRPVEALLSTLGLFAAAAFRLMPSAVRIVISVQTLRFSLPVIDTVHRELARAHGLPSMPRGTPLPFQSALVLDRVTFRYPNTETAALRDVTLTVPRGSSTGFIGGSGAGKTTIVDVILGLLTPESGRITVDGTDIQTNLRGWQDQIGYVPQVIYLTDDTLRRNVAFGIPDSEIDDAAVMRAILAAQLDQFVGELPLGLEAKVGERGVQLSGGQRQRIGIARALYHDPDVLVLDEATSALDTATEDGVMEAVKALRGDKTLLIVAHRLSTIAHCDRVYRMDAGALVEEEGALPVRPQRAP